MPEEKRPKRLPTGTFYFVMHRNDTEALVYKVTAETGVERPHIVSDGHCDCPAANSGRVCRHVPMTKRHEYFRTLCEDDCQEIGRWVYLLIRPWAENVKLRECRTNTAAGIGPDGKPFKDAVIMELEQFDPKDFVPEKWKELPKHAVMYFDEGGQGEPYVKVVLILKSLKRQTEGLIPVLGEKPKEEPKNPFMTIQTLRQPMAIEFAMIPISMRELTPAETLKFSQGQKGLKLDE